MFQGIDNRVVYTDATFKEFGDKLGYLLAQVPYHPSGRYLLSFLAGKIPEWRQVFVIMVKKEPFGKIFIGVCLRILTRMHEVRPLDSKEM